MPKITTQRDLVIAQMYAEGFTPSHLAMTFKLSRQRIWQIAVKYGVARPQVEATLMAIPEKRKRRASVRRYGWDKVDDMLRNVGAID